LSKCQNSLALQNDLPEKHGVRILVIAPGTDLVAAVAFEALIGKNWSDLQFKESLGFAQALGLGWPENVKPPVLQ
jgi:hypothetical protein